MIKRIITALILSLFLCVSASGSIIAHYKMNDNAASVTVTDETGNHDGTYKDGSGNINTDTGDQTGKINGALDFGFSNNEYVDCGNGPAVTGSSNFAVSVWINTAIGQTNTFILNQRATGSADGSYAVGLSSTGTAHFEIYNTAYGFSFDGSQVVSDGNWHHVVCVKTDLTSGKIYVDGVFDNSGTGTARDLADVAVVIGRHNGGSGYFNGFIDDVRIFDEELSQAQVTLLYNEGDGTEGHYYTIGSSDDYPSHTAMNAGEDVEPDDIISFRKDGVYREIVTVEDSGTDGHPIIYTSHGTGADPIINGADIITTWTSAAGSWVTSWTNTPTSNWETVDPADYNLRAVIANGSASESGTKVKISIKGGGNAETLDGCSIGLRSGSGQDYSSAPTRVTFGSDNFVAIGIGATVVSDEMTFSFDDSVDHLIHLWWDAGVSGAYNSSNGDSFYREAVGGGGLSDQTLVEDTSLPDDQSGWRSPVVKIDVYQPSSYQATCNTEPHQVWYDGTRLTENDTATTGVGANEWDWNANTLYVNVGEDPDDGVLEAAQRDNCILVTSKSYITFDGLTLRYSNGAVGNGGSGIEVTFGVISNIIVQNCTIHDHNWDGIWFEGTNGSEITDCTVQGNIVYNCSLNELASGAIHSIYLDSSMFQRNTVYNNLEHGFRMGDSDSNIFQNNTCYGNGSSGISITHSTGTSSNNIIRYNLCYANDTLDGAKSEIQLLDTGGGNQVYYNIMYNGGTHGLRTDTADGDFIYNNVFYNMDDRGLSIQNNSANLTIKNNIFMGNGQHMTFNANSLVGHDIDYNIYYTDGAAKFNWGGSTYNFADWKTNSGQDGNSAIGDPLFVDAPDELITNGTFADWTTGDPTNWPVTGEVGSDPEISEVGTTQRHGGDGTGMCNIYTSDGTNIYMGSNTVSLIVDRKYQLSINVDTVTMGAIRISEVYNGQWYNDISSAGNYSWVYIAEFPQWTVRIAELGVATDVTFDDVSIKPVGPFRLQAGSPCINAGVDVSLTTDYQGNLVGGVGWIEIGAYSKLETIRFGGKKSGGKHTKFGGKRK